MGDSSDSEEFYDAEEFTPIKGSKRSSLCKSITITESVDSEKDKSPARLKEPVKEYHPMKTEEPASSGSIEDDRTIITNVVQGRKKFQELRRCLQTDEEDEGVMPDPSGSVDQNYTLEHPFKIISHDTMSLQSMTSLGRIGRILSGASESQSNFRETMPLPSALSREPSTISDDPITVDSRMGTQNVLGTAEPDVIASTKANSLRGRAAPALATSAQLSPATPPAPTKPPRRKKRNKLHGSQSLSTMDGDNLSVCTDTDVDVEDRVRLHALVVDAPDAGAGAGLPSPATTIESLTREFQDSLELSHSKYASDLSISVIEPRHDTSRVRADTDTTERYGEWPAAAAGRASTVPVSGEEARRPHPHHHHHTGHSSLGSTTRRSGATAGGATLGAGAGAGGRRRSAGDEAALGAALRTRTVSGHTLSDREILDQVVVTNLDTGERVPLSVAETKLPQCINPLSLHIMRLTSEYIHNHDDNDDNTRETDEESESVCAGGTEDEAKDTKRESADRQATGIKRKTEKLKRFFGTTVRKTVSAARSLAAEVSQARHKEDVADIADDVRGETNIKLKASNSHKGPYDFDNSVRHVQEMGSGHMGAVWCCKFSVCGQLLATAGQDKLLRVWVARDAADMFQEMRTKYNANKKCSPSPSQESLSSPAPAPVSPPPGPAAPFLPMPFCTYSGHASDLLDVSWSKNYFILSSSMDKTVRLWHISRGECLCCFQHIDFVTAIVFHPRDDRYFLSGSLDGKLRLWDIPDKKVAVWNEVDGKTKLITAANFCQNGKFAVVGTYDGRCIFYTTDQLKYHTQIDVRSTRGKNSTGRKISGIEPMPNDDKILVTSNDSRIRLYDLRDLNLSCKYKGYVNVSSQIKASFSHDGKYIVSGSENQCIYIWKTYHDYSKFTSVRRDRNDFWEGIKAHNAVVTCAVFAPNPDHMIRMIDERELEAKGSDPNDLKAGAEPSMVSSSQSGHVLVSADFNGCIKVFVHKAKPKHSSLPASALA